MYAITTFLIVAVVSLVFGQLATGALIATGVPPEIAAFQARSAFSGAGFTTTETENVVNHPVRRRIVAATMLVGSLGTPTLVVSVLAGLIAPGPGSTTLRALVAVSGVVLLAMALLNRPIRRLLVEVGQRYTRRRLLPALGEETEELLVLGDDFVVDAIRFSREPHPAPRSLRALATALPGCTVLGIRRGDTYVGEPPVDIELRAGDELILHGRRARIAQLSDAVG